MIKHTHIHRQLCVLPYLDLVYSHHYYYLCGAPTYTITHFCCVTT